MAFLLNHSRKEAWRSRWPGQRLALPDMGHRASGRPAPITRTKRRELIMPPPAGSAPGRQGLGWQPLMAGGVSVAPIFGTLMDSAGAGRPPREFWPLSVTHPGRRMIEFADETACILSQYGNPSRNAEYSGPTPDTRARLSGSRCKPVRRSVIQALSAPCVQLPPCASGVAAVTGRPLCGNGRTRTNATS